MTGRPEDERARRAGRSRGAGRARGRNALRIARVELRLALRDRETVFWSFVAPVLMAWFFGSLFGGSSAPTPTAFALEAGANPPWVAEAFTRLIAARGLRPVDGGRVARVVLPDSLAERIAADRGDLTVRVEKRDASDARAGEVAVAARQALYAFLLGADPAWRRVPPDSAALARLVAPGPLVVRTRIPAGAPRQLDSMSHQVMAMLVMFLMFQMLTYFMTSWADDVRRGRLRRITMSPVRPSEIFGGHLLARFAWGALQVAVLLGVGARLLGVAMEVPAAGFAAVLAAYLGATVAVGLFLGTFFTSPEKANAVGVMSGLLLAALGGCWWPLEVVSPVMRHFALLLPTGIAMDALDEMLVRGARMPFPAANVAGLVLWTAVLMPLAVRRIRRQLVT